MWLQLLLLQSEVVRKQVGVVSGRFGAGFGKLAPNRPQTTPTGPPDVTHPFARGHMATKWSWNSSTVLVIGPNRGEILTGPTSWRGEPRPVDDRKSGTISESEREGRLEVDLSGSQTRKKFQ
jgi:hypothetical protein